MYKSLGGLDALVLSRLVEGLPVSEDPYGDIGRPLGLSAAEVLAVVRRLVEKGVVTRVGPFFNSFKMGHVSTLCALDAPDEVVDGVAGLVNSCPEVARSFLMDGRPNLWFTVLASSKTAMLKVVGEIEKKGGAGPVRPLPALRMFRSRAVKPPGGVDE